MLGILGIYHRRVFCRLVDLFNSTSILKRCFSNLKEPTMNILEHLRLGVREKK